MTSTDNTLELIERNRAAVMLLANTSMNLSLGDWCEMSTDLLAPASELERLKNLAIAAGYPDWEAMAEGVKAMRAELEALAVYAPQYAQRINAALTKGPTA